MGNMKVGVPHLLFVSLAMLSFGCNGDVLPVPPLDITAKDLAKYLSLGDTNISFPALYVFGDSYIDSGNNNNLKNNFTFNYPPYGIDFGGKATGRVTNGRTAVDFIAQVAGLPFPPAMQGMSDAERKSVRTGVNYASATAGVQPEPEQLKPDGDFFSLDEQVKSFEETTKLLRTQFESVESWEEYISKSIFFMHISSNDLGIYWAKLFKQFNYDPKAYQTHLSQVYSEQLKKLHELGARKFLINNVSPLGCMPIMRYSKYIRPKGPFGNCWEDINTRITAYNQHLKDFVPKMESSLPGSKFVLADFHKIIGDIHSAPASYGIKNTTHNCCIDIFGDGTGPCKKDTTPCKDRSSYLFYDSNHPTEVVHFIWARRLLKESSLSSPFSLIELAKA